MVRASSGDRRQTAITSLRVPTGQRARFLKRVCENIETLGVIGSKVRRIREPSEDAATAKAVAEAAEWYRRAIPRLLDKF
jgi:hypothetical protein